MHIYLAYNVLFNYVGMDDQSMGTHINIFKKHSTTYYFMQETKIKM